MNIGMIYMLLVASIISIVISVVSLVLILNVIKKQNMLFELVKREMTWKVTFPQQDNNKENMVQGNNQAVRKQGIIICKKCYAPISETSVTCPVCKTSVSRR